MKDRKRQPVLVGPPASARVNLLWALAAACLLLLIVGLLRPRREVSAKPEPVVVLAPAVDLASSNAVRDRLLARLPGRRAAADPLLTPEQVVSNKVAQFARSRREFAYTLAIKHGVAVRSEFEHFFDAVEAGRWEDVEANFKDLQKLRDSDHQPEGFLKLWPAVLETFGCAEAAHDWPAQKLLDYGEAVLGSLRPGMAYVGGTDAGRFIPTLLNETGDGERHIVVTQNAFADASYLDYVGFLHGDRMATLTKEDSQRAFSDYMADAQRRLVHDRDFPGEPKQLRHGEDVKVVDNRVQVSGQVAVMDINERLLRSMMEKNPDLSFAIEESFPFKSMYGNASPLGPLMELRANADQNPLTAESAAQSIEFWRATAHRIQNDLEAPAGSDVCKAWAQLAMAQANLYADRSFAAEAEQACRFARDLSPGYLEPVGTLAGLLLKSGRAAEAATLLDDFARQHSEQRAELEALRRRLLPVAARRP